jgi:SAM-dependent methyltransferase
MSGSISFDRASEYYDRTRGMSEEGARRTVELLAAELGDRGLVLEVGVGTGQLAIPLHRAGIPVIGIDLAWSMLAKLIEKAGGRSAVPLVIGDATRMPFADDSFGAAYLRWVLHLIPAWERVGAELVRVVRRGGTILANLGGKGTGPREEIHRRFVEVAGIAEHPAGLGWSDFEALDAVMTRLGAIPRALTVFTDTERDGPHVFLDALERNLHSWTWPMPEDLRLRTAAEVRDWAVERFGPLDLLPKQTFAVEWRAYDLP